LKKLFLASIAFIAFNAGSSALAADLPVKARVPAPDLYNWTGCYAGANAGGAWQKVDNILTATNGTPGYFGAAVLPEVSRNGTGGLESSGFTTGAQVGCNYQSGILVGGVETDFNWMPQHAHVGGRFVYSTDPSSPYFLNVFDDKKWLWTVRGRIGVTATDRVLLYATGGFAALRMDFTQTFSETPFTTPPNGTPQIATFSKTKGGWTVGAGVEAGLWDNWTVKAEYLYAQFDGETVSGSFTGGVGLPRPATLANSLSDIHLHVARVGLNYRFGGSDLSR
jgi:outer membrane immunogenic protein